MSTSRPPKKPPAAPKIEPRSSATDDDRHEQKVRHAAEDVDVRQQRHLHDGDEEEQSSRLDDVEWVHLRSSGTRIATESSDEKSDERIHLDVLELVDVVLVDARHPPDQDPARVDVGQRRELRAGGHDEVARLHDLVLRDAAEHELRAAAGTVLDEPVRASSSGRTPRRRSSRSVRSVTLREAVRDARDPADETVGRHDGIVDAHALLRARRHGDALLDVGARRARSRSRSPL